MIGADGSPIGIMPLANALDLAREQGLDLVEIASQATPPVCRIIDFGKYKFEIAKKSKEAKKKQKVVKVKEVEMRPNIDDHDYATKVRRIIEFLLKDHKVRVVVKFMGREIVHKERGTALIQKIIEETKGIGILEQQAKMEGRQYFAFMALDPNKRKQMKKGEQSSAEDEVTPGSQETVQTDSDREDQV